MSLNEQTIRDFKVIAPQLETRPSGKAPQEHLRQADSLRQILLRAGFTMLLFGLVVLWQFVSGAYQSEFVAHADESAHYVTGLMMKDYFASHFSTSPVPFAEDFYLHYPKVAIGHWPPVFYVIQGIWMLLFSASRVSILLLMAFIATGAASAIQDIVESIFGTVAGGLTAIVFLCLPVVQKQSGMVMADILVALWCFRAAMAFGRYLNSHRWRDAAAFGVYASLAIMTKGNGLALVLLPPIAIALAGKPLLFKRRSLWGASAIPAVLCGPWFYFTFALVHNGWEREPGLDYTLDAIVKYTSLLGRTTGIGIVVAAVIGAISVVRHRQEIREQAKGAWASMMALFLSVTVFQWVVPATIEDRLLLPLLGPMLLFAAAGVVALARGLASIASVSRWVAVSLVIGILALIFAKSTFALPTKYHFGFDRAAEKILSDSRLQNAVILVSSEGNGEGGLISELAMREARPGHIILRASKVLAHSLWDGRKYQVSYRTPADVMQYLSHIPVRVLVLDNLPGPQLEHHGQLRQMIDDNPQEWVLIGSYSDHSASDARTIQMYRLAGHDDLPSGKVRVDLNPMIDLVLHN